MICCEALTLKPCVKMRVLGLRPSSGSLPEALQHLVLHADGAKFSLRVNQYADVEPILASLRQGGAVIEDMQLQQADLEDVFLQIMDSKVSANGFNVYADEYGAGGGK